MRAKTKQVKIYTTPTCPYCNVAKRYFAERDIDFVDVDVSSDTAGLKEMVTDTGQYGVPVVVFGERAMVGWNAQEFERMISD